MENNTTEIQCTNSLAEALDLFLIHEYCLIIMDFQPFKIDCLDLIRTVREIRCAPLLAITPQLSSEEKIALFHAGVNACIEKPVDLSVCVAQAQTLINLYLDSNNNVKQHHPLIFGTELIISQLYRQVIIEGTPLELTRTEFDLLFCLAQHHDQVWSRSQSFDYIWSDGFGVGGENTVRTHIGNLRRKLADVGKEYIHTIRGIGYKFVSPKTMEF